VVDFFRKFFLNIPDFRQRKPKITILGQVFNCRSQITKAKFNCVGAKIPKNVIVEIAQRAVDLA